MLSVSLPSSDHLHRLHPSLNRRGRWGTTDASQPVSSIDLCSPLPAGAWRTLGLSIPWCYLLTSSSVCLVFFLLSLSLARWFWPDLMNGKHDQPLQLASFYDRQQIFMWSNCLLDLGTDFLVGNMVFV